jgi:transcriptional regulator with XRE-family HTH domain
METNSNELGQFLVQMRKKLNLSLRAVQAETDISNAYLSQLETGKIKTPSPTVLHTLAQRYGVEYNHLMKLAGYPVPKRDVGEVPDTTPDLAARLGGVSPEEEDALIEFLNLLRKRTGGRS